MQMAVAIEAIVQISSFDENNYMLDWVILEQVQTVAGLLCDSLAKNQSMMLNNQFDSKVCFPSIVFMHSIYLTY